MGREQKNKHVIAVRSEPPIGKTFSTLDRKSVPVLQLLSIKLATVRHLKFSLTESSRR